MNYIPFGKDLENLPQAIALGGLMITNFMMILNAKKSNMESKLVSQISGIRKDFELQTILFSLEGANIIFREKSVRFINMISESIFSSCDPIFRNFSDSTINIESQQDFQHKLSDHIQNVKIFKAFRNIIVTTDDEISNNESKSAQTNKSSTPNERSKRECNEDIIQDMIQMKEKTQENVIEEALNQIVQNQVCLSLSEIRLIDQKILDNIIFKKVKVGQGD